MDERVRMWSVEMTDSITFVAGLDTLEFREGCLTLADARLLRDWLTAHLPEHPTMPAGALDDMEADRG